MRPALEYVAAGYGGKLRETHAANLCAMTPYRFSRAFKAAYSVTFQEYVIRYRVREAARLLQNPNATIADVAVTVGFNDPSYFTRIFKRYHRVAPSAYREDTHEQREPLTLWAALEPGLAPRGS